MLASLTDRLGTVADLQAAARLLEWDQETYMPRGAAEVRAQQLATLKSLAHAHFTDEKTQVLVEAIDENDLPDENSRALLRVTRRDLVRAIRRPPSLVTRQALATARALEAWKQARQDDDFPHFAPHLEEIFALAREEAEALGFEEHVYDALLEEYEPGMTRSEVVRIFEPLREDLVALVEAIREAEQVDDSLLHSYFDPRAQWDLGLEVAAALGYDFDRGRQDLSTHPFSTAFGPPFDVRITTRVAEGFFPTAFFGTLHEVGHALYEQGISPLLARTPLADGTSLGVHESQSRLWENLVGRSRPFWKWAQPAAGRHFPDVLGDVPAETIYRGVNKVEPSLIRVEADEVTYSLHVMLRFELESAMLTGDLAVRDLPSAWNDRMQEYLGLTPPDDREGCLQDIHWSLGAVGYFPTYTLGSLMSVQLFDAAAQDLDLPGQVSDGEFRPLLDWLQEKVHRHGRVLSARDVMVRATGQELSAEPWLAYARQKFGDIYRL
jgi:carboxypeptidase Taq